MLHRVVPLLIVASAGFYLTQSLQLPFGSAARPGAGFYPTLVAIFGCLVGLAATAQSFRMAPVASTAVDVDPEAAAERRRVASTIVALAVFCLVLPWIGYPLAACVFVIAMLLGLGSRPPAAIAMGIVSAAGSYALFGWLLDVPLPRGPW